MTRRILPITLLVALVAGQSIPVSAARMLCGMERPAAAADRPEAMPTGAGESDGRESCDRCEAPRPGRLPADTPLFKSRTCCQFEATAAPETDPSIVPAARRGASEAGPAGIVLLAVPVLIVETPSPVGPRLARSAPSRFDPLQAHRTTILRR